MENKINTTISLDSSIFKEFKKKCIDQEKKVSKRIEELLLEDLETETETENGTIRTKPEL